jgi:hypothetical protein
MKHWEVITRVPVLLICVVGTVASAQAEEIATTRVVAPSQPPSDDGSSTDLRIGLAVGRADDSMLYGTTTTIVVEGSGRGVFSSGVAGGAVSANWALGSTVDGGIAYGIDVGLGVGARVGRAQMGVTIGGGFSGISAGLPFALQVPVIGFVGIPLGPLRLVGGVRGDWVFASGDRQDGANTFTAFDEVGVEAGVFLGGEPHSIGLVGWAREQLGTSIIGASFVYGEIQTSNK